MILFEFAKRNIRLHWLRSFLAVLGIVIGVASIAAMGILGNSMVLSIGESLSSVGDTIVVSPHTGGSGMGPPGKTNEKITDRMVEQIKRAVTPNLAIPVYSGGDRMKIGSKETAGVIYGIKIDDIPTLLEVDEGSYSRGETAAMVGRKFADENDIKVGSRISVGTKGIVRVSGILKERGMGFDINPDYGIVVTDNWYAQAYNATDYDMVVVKVRDLAQIDSVKESIEKALNKREQVVNVLETKKILETIMTAFSSISTFVMAIGGISLIVAGVSIFNIMMMSVTERIREIGIMRSLGAQRLEVMKMFLYEALILGLVGSTIGGVFSLLGGYLVSSLILKTTKYVFVPSSLLPVVYGMAFGIAVCLVCGIYPAWKAANLNPIEALRHE
ncbi:MAG: ABC transporter permease [Methanoregulaceae archaeon]|jgi:putative ABC transport system permease protein|nr:ABC transporter permease [Methanoregulaceae archaeon]